MKTKHSAFIKLKKPHIALITNHGYGGVDIPIGGAPDTGGQNVYVNAYAHALDQLGYKVTIYARGGFPYYESKKIRTGQDFLTPSVRYIFVPGGGDEFIRKEDIAIALNEELDWIYDHIQQESALKNVFPWEYYEMINSHYWDAGVLGASLVAKWQNDFCTAVVEFLTKGAVNKNRLKFFIEDRHFQSVAEAPDFSLGELLLESVADRGYVHEKEVMVETFRNWFEKSAIAPEFKSNFEMLFDWENLGNTVAAETKELRPVILAKVLGTTLLNFEVNDLIFKEDIFEPYQLSEGLFTYNDLINIGLETINKHVWTPHSLSVIKERNFKDKSNEISRDLKFRERRSHERMICNYTPAFGSTSYEIAESLITNYGVSIEDIVFYPPGVDIEIFRNYTDSELGRLYKYLEAETGYSKKEITSSTVLFETSRMDSTKRKDVLLKAFAEVVEKTDEKCLLFIGGGPENKEYKSLQKILDETQSLKGKAFLLGFIPEEYLAMMFGFCDIYVSASEMEGFGMSVAQAAIAAKPVVSSDKIPFTGFYLKDVATILPAGDVSAFADGILRLVGNEEDRKLIGQRTREKTMGLEWKNLTEKFIEDLNKKNFNIAVPE